MARSGEVADAAGGSGTGARHERGCGLCLLFALGCSATFTRNYSREGLMGSDVGKMGPMPTNNQPALLVVDVQQGFDDVGYWGPRNNPACEDNIRRLLEHWRAQQRPVVFIRHDSTEEHSPLRPDHPGNAFKPVVTGEPDVLVSKHTNSCFYGDPDLHQWLQSNHIQQLVLCGITTNHCCETTARMAGNLGYDVRFVLDATHTFDRGDMTADQLAHATATNLNGEFATVVSTDEALRG